MFWNWQFVGQIIPLLAKASVVTIVATLLGFLIAAFLGLAFALGRLFGPKWIAVPLIGLIEGIRSTPLLIQIFFIYFVLPEAGISIGAMTAGVLALGLHYATYCSEVYRAGLANVPRGQWEASLALNLPTWRTFRDVIIPQAIPPVVPALGNYLVSLFKDTPLLSAIGVLELLQTAKIIGSENFRYTEPITLVGLIFLVLSLLSAVIIGFIERWLKRYVMRS
jgi:polar amino acid transport system permease protein